MSFAKYLKRAYTGKLRKKEVFGNDIGGTFVRTIGLKKAGLQVSEGNYRMYKKIFRHKK